MIACADQDVAGREGSSDAERREVVEEEENVVRTDTLADEIPVQWPPSERQPAQQQ